MSLAAAQASATRAQLQTGSGSASSFSHGIRVGSGAKISKRAARRSIAPRAVATPPREDAARNQESSGRESATRQGNILGPNDAPSLRCGARRAEVPYFGSPSDRAVLVNDAARDAIRAADAKSFIALPEADDPNLVALKEAMQKGWQKCEPLGSGSASAWPELFDAGAALIRATICSDAGWPADAVEILPGTGWLANDDDASSEDQNIDWVIRRPEGHVVSSKVHFATRLHRDPDSWTNPRTPQRPKDGWTELSMPKRGKYSYRFINVWVARSAIDPTGQVWQSPLVVCLPRDGGAREWAFERRALAMDDEEAEKEFAVRGVNPLDAKTWIPGINRAFRPLWNARAREEREERERKRDDGTLTNDVFTDSEASSASPFEFPELTPSDAHVFVSAPALVFDSFDLWHGAATWSDDDDAKKTLRTIDTKGRQPFHRARCSVEARFRVRVDVEKARANPKTGREARDVSGDSVSPWGPFAAAVASGKFRYDGLRDSEARYDLDKGDGA